MAEGDGHIYNEFLEKVLNGSYNLASGGNVLKLILVTGHVLDIDNDLTYANVSPDECSGSGYTAGGIQLVGQTVSKDNVNNRSIFDGNDITWSSLNVSAGGDPNYAIMYNDTSSDLLMIAWELTTGTNGGDYTIQWHTEGILLASQGV
jgi:hypothetical protein